LRLFGPETFCPKDIGEKCTRKMLIQLTTGINFTNILHFTLVDPKSAKRH